jgi:hypothetical protein
MAEAVSRQSFTGVAPVRSQDSGCDIYDGQSDSVTGLSPSICFLLSYHWPTLTLIYVLSLPEGKVGEGWGLSENQRSFGTTAALGDKLLSLSL